MKLKIWVILKQKITTLLWPGNSWFLLLDKMDEIRKHIETGKSESGEFIWDLGPIGGGVFTVTIKKAETGD